MWVEDHLTKDQILEHYLNIAYFGDGAYGVQSAAHHFFGTTADQLTLSQAALLAGMLKSPTNYDPTHNPQDAQDRRDLVIQRMLDLHVITSNQADFATSRPLGLHVTQIPNGCLDSTAPWFCQYLLSYLQQDPALGNNLTERNHAIFGGGLTIKTTLDPRYQLAADKAVSDHVLPTDSTAVGALAMVQPHTGAVRAVAQSRPMGTNKARGETMLNFTVPTEYGGAAGFQPGSTFKAFVLSAAIKQGIPLNTKFPSPNPIQVDERDYTTCGGGPVGSAIDTFHNEGTEAGTFDIYSGTAESVNTYFVQLERLTGLCEPFTLANEMGMNLDADKYQVVSFTLGVADESPVAMANAYATFAARGVYCPATPVVQILDRDGKVIPQPANPCKRVMAPAFADAVSQVLQGVMQGQGTGSRTQHRPTGCRQDRDDGRLPVGLVHRLHTQHGGRQRRRRGVTDPASALADRGHPARQRHRIPDRWWDCGTDLAAGHVRGRALPARPRLHRPRPERGQGPDGPDPGTVRLQPVLGGPAAHEPRIQAADRLQRRLLGPPRHGCLHQPVR